jgi:hypothetical protein
LEYHFRNVMRSGMTTRTFALVLGIIYLVVGIAGFIPGLVTPGEVPAEGAAPAEAGTDHGLLFGLFPVNLLHNLVHIAFGIWGIVAYRSFGGAVTFARVFAVVFGILAVLGLIPGLNTLFGLVPLYSHDIWLHALTAAVAAYFGWGPPAKAAPTSVVT